MSSRAGMTSIVLASVIVVHALLALFGIGMDNAFRNPTPRINPMTIGLGLVPLLSASVIVYVWSRPRRAGVWSIIGRVALTLIAAAVAAVCLFLSLFLTAFVG